MATYYSIYKRPQDDVSDEEKENQSKIDFLDTTLKNAKNAGYDDFNDFWLDLKKRHDVLNKNKKQNDQITVSQLINVKKNEMCYKGHTNFQKSHANWQKSQLGYTNFQKSGTYFCAECGNKNDIMYCMACWYHIYYKANKTEANNNLMILCRHCRIQIANKIKKIIRIKERKAIMFRQEIIKDPTLETDVKCALGRKAAVDELVNDIVALDKNTKRRFMLMVIDLDNLKALNNILGHEKADEVIVDVGSILKKYRDQVNDGIWKYKGDGVWYSFEGFRRAWTYRTGGDEFMFVLEADFGRKDDGNDKDAAAHSCILARFYKRFKKEINDLSKKHFKGISEKDFKENYVDRDRKPLNKEIVGISIGVYLPWNCELGLGWIECADKVALEQAKKIPGKNGICFYMDQMGLIPNNKTNFCLNIGAFQGFQKK